MFSNIPNIMVVLFQKRLFGIDSIVTTTIVRIKQQLKYEE